ncbi:putative selenium-dependent hydroxylase accessory protein YqeC [bacterium CPR1]|nr:putative selenium-dependent hydroxylase accessory protein YqeC [bacterium CPR1]
MTLLEALELTPVDRVSLIGGGGKTTLLYQLGREARERGWPVVLSTTTRMAAPTRDEALWAVPAEPGKLQGPGMEALEGVQDRLLVVEADGSRGLPLKGHASHEPVLLASTTTLVVVAGVSALGQPLEQVAHRSELLAARLGCALSQVVDDELFLRALSLMGPGAAPVLNQADDPLLGRRLAWKLGRPCVIRGRWGQERIA